MSDTDVLYEAVIELPPVTKKNSQKIIFNKKQGRPMIIPSSKYTEYERNARWFLNVPEAPISEPCNVRCTYYMPTRRRVDLTNLLEATDDMLVACKVLEDDNSQIIGGHDFSRVYYDKENPRTEITITRLNKGGNK